MYVYPDACMYEEGMFTYSMYKCQRMYVCVHVCTCTMDYSPRHHPPTMAIGKCTMDYSPWYQRPSMPNGKWTMVSTAKYGQQKVNYGL